ncbi:MAG: cupin domain-containing protein [bacterium]|jgi:uncharacterized protein
MSKIKITQLNNDEIEGRGIRKWPVWEKEVSRFEWTYTGKEECLILEGEFNVETQEGTYHVKPGDFVTFEDGLNCIWDIKSAVKKHYHFP